MYLESDASGGYKFEKYENPNVKGNYDGALLAEINPDEEGSSMDVQIEAGAVRFNKTALDRCK